MKELGTKTKRMDKEKWPMLKEVLLKENGSKTQRLRFMIKPPRQQGW